MIGIDIHSKVILTAVRDFQLVTEMPVRTELDDGKSNQSPVHCICKEIHWINIFLSFRHWLFNRFIHLAAIISCSVNKWPGKRAVTHMCVGYSVSMLFWLEVSIVRRVWYFSFYSLLSYFISRKFICKKLVALREVW